MFDLCTSSSVPHKVPVLRQKRSDDFGQLDAVMAQMTQRIDALTAQLTQQDAKMTQMENSHNAQITALLANITALQARDSEYKYIAIIHSALIDFE